MAMEIQSVPDKAGEPYHLQQVKQIPRRFDKYRAAGDEGRGLRQTGLRSDYSFSDTAESSCRFQ